MYTGIMTSTCLPFTGKCRYFENLNSRCFDLCFVAVLICRYFENTENIAILIISRLNKFYWYCMVFINVLYLPVISLLSSKPTISHREHFSV
jgi:hypothetical protein